MLESVIQHMQGRICSIISGYHPSIYLFGSVTLDDFQPGWSDIDILCLTDRSLSQEHAKSLVGLRQSLVTANAEPIYRLFEGAFLSIDALLSQNVENIVYWGTSGQRITDAYCFDSFSMVQLHTTGRLLCGTDVRSRLPIPSDDDLRQAVIQHYQTIRKYALLTDTSVYACGWLLDIARCLYTLRTAKIIAKTAAGEWALTEGLCNIPDTMRKTLDVRKNPQTYKDTPEFQSWASQLGPDVQKFANVLEREIG